MRGIYYRGAILSNGSIFLGPTLDPVHAASWYICSQPSPRHRASFSVPQVSEPCLVRHPIKPPLRPKVLQAWNLDGYRRELVEYATFAEERVHAYVLTPDRPSGKLTGMVAVHQDGAVRPYNIGKDEPAGLGAILNWHTESSSAAEAILSSAPTVFLFGSRSLANSKFKQTFDGLQ